MVKSSAVQEGQMLAIFIMYSAYFVWGIKPVFFFWRGWGVCRGCLDTVSEDQGLSVPYSHSRCHSAYGHTTLTSVHERKTPSPSIYVYSYRIRLDPFQVSISCSVWAASSSILQYSTIRFITCWRLYVRLLCVWENTSYAFVLFNFVGGGLPPASTEIPFYTLPMVRGTFLDFKLNEEFICCMYSVMMFIFFYFTLYTFSNLNK